MWQNYSIGVLCIAISIWQNHILSGSRLLSVRAKCWDLLFQTTGIFSSLLPWLPKWAWDSSADSRRLGCGVALYFGLLTVSLTQCLASLAFFATPGGNKELKACRDSISSWLLFSLLLWQARMIRESMGRNDDGISSPTSPPARMAVVLICWCHVPSSLLQWQENRGRRCNSGKKNVRHGNDATWLPNPPHQLNYVWNKQKKSLNRVTWLVHMPFGHGEGALLCGSCF